MNKKYSRTNKRKAQSSLEFLLLVGFMVLVFSSFFIIIENRLSIEKQINRQKDLQEVSSLIESELLVAHSVRDGFVRPLELPNTLNGESYNVYLFDSDEIVINTSDYEHILFLPFQIHLFNGSNKTIYQGEILKKSILQKQNGNLYIQVGCASKELICDGLDNNCNNLIDEGVLKICNLTSNPSVKALACSENDLPYGYNCSSS